MAVVMANTVTTVSMADMDTMENMVITGRTDPGILEDRGERRHGTER